MNKREFFVKMFYTFFFMMTIIVLSKIKLQPIFGTPSRFSLLAMFAPIVPYFTGISWGFIAIFGARILQFIIGISTVKDLFSYLIFMPVFFGGIYFARLFKKEKGLVLIPIISIILFNLHPIGRVVWYYSMFWLIPIAITLLQPWIRKLTRLRDLPTIYIYALASTFIDHAVGSVMFLYYLNIPAIYWNMAIPYVPFERAIYAIGITIFYCFVKKSIESFSKVVPIEIVKITPVERKMEIIIKQESSKNDYKTYN